MWRPGSRVSIDAQKAGRELERIERKNGNVTPAAVVDAARPESNPLHDHFEWDDAVAAEAHREDQARRLISAITIDTSRSNLTPAEPRRLFINVVEQGEQHYVSLTRVMSDKELRAQVLERAKDDLRAWRKRYADLTEFAAVFAAIDAQDGEPGSTRSAEVPRKRA